MSPFTESLLFAVAAACANVIGGIIVTYNKWAHQFLRYFIALGSGFMLGTVFLEMFPESIALTKSAPVLALLGYGIVHMFEHTFASHLHFGEETHHDEVTNPAVGISALIGMLVHTFFDGVAIGAGFTISPGVGLLIFLGGLPAQDSGRLYDLLDNPHLRKFRQSRSWRSGVTGRVDTAGRDGRPSGRWKRRLCSSHLDWFDALRRGNGSDAGSQS